MNFLKYILIFFILNFAAVISQQQPVPVSPETDKKANQPFDLPNAIIYGDATLNVALGAKQNPKNPSPISSTFLDTLNSLEKHSLNLLPSEKVPASIEKTSLQPGYLSGAFGRYTTANLNAGYSFEVKEYSLFAKGGFDYSGGNIRNADYKKYNLELNSHYLAPSKYWIFAGSKTHTQFFFDEKDFKYYSQLNPKNGSNSNLGLIIDVDGNSDGYDYKTGIGFKSFGISTDNKKETENNLNSYLRISKKDVNFITGGELNLDFNTYRGMGYHFLQLMGINSWIYDKYFISLDYGLQNGNSLNKDSRFGLLINGKLNYQYSQNVTLNVALKSGLSKNSFTNMGLANPFTNNIENIDFAYDIINLKAFANYNPTMDFGITGGFGYRNVKRLNVFIADTLGTFKAIALDASIIEIFGEAYYSFSDKNKIVTNITFNLSSTDSSKFSLPYFEPIKVNLSYLARFTNEFEANFGVTFVGTRETELSKSVKLDSYQNLFVRFNYQLNDNLHIFANVNNLLNSKIYIWQGYQEHGMFGNLGVFWKF